MLGFWNWVEFRRIIGCGPFGPPENQAWVGLGAQAGP